MKYAAAALIALCRQVVLASVDLVMCKGKPPSNWGPPNCNAADEAVCADWCVNRIACVNGSKDPQHAGCWRKDNNRRDCW